MYRQVYKLYKRIFTKLLDYYRHIERGIDFGYSSNGLNNSAIYGSKFDLNFSDPENIKELYLGKIGSANSQKIKAYYYNFDLCLSIEKVDYVELICEDTGININNKNLPPLGKDIKPQSEPFINILKLRFVVGHYLSFYKKIKRDIKKRIDEEHSKIEDFSYPSSDSDCEPELCHKPYNENLKKKYLPKNYPDVSLKKIKDKTILDKWNEQCYECNISKSNCSSLTHCDCCDELMCKKCNNPQNTLKYDIPEKNINEDYKKHEIKYDINNNIKNNNDNNRKIDFHNETIEDIRIDMKNNTKNNNDNNRKIDFHNETIEDIRIDMKNNTKNDDNSNLEYNYDYYCKNTDTNSNDTSETASDFGEIIVKKINKITPEKISLNLDLTSDIDNFVNPKNKNDKKNDKIKEKKNKKNDRKQKKKDY